MNKLWVRLVGEWKAITWHWMLYREDRPFVLCPECHAYWMGSQEFEKSTQNPANIPMCDACLEEAVFYSEKDIVQSKKQVYEIIADCGIEVIECDTDNEARALAARYAGLWKSDVKLYRVPAINLSSASSFDVWPGGVE